MTRATEIGCTADRAMSGGHVDRSPVPDDVPNFNRHSIRCPAEPFAAWAAIGLLNPKPTVEGKINV